MPLITVKPSKIHGQGVFAARDIQAGETLIEWACDAVETFALPTQLLENIGYF